MVDNQVCTTNGLFYTNALCYITPKGSAPKGALSTQDFSGFKINCTSEELDGDNDHVGYVVTWVKANERRSVVYTDEGEALIGVEMRGQTLNTL